jgi:hypothetical protein
VTTLLFALSLLIPGTGRWHLVLVGCAVTSLGVLVLSFLPIQWPQFLTRSKLAATFGWEDAHLRVSIQNDGTTMRDAVVSLALPDATYASLEFVDNKGLPRADRTRAHERGSDGLELHHKGLHLLGGGHTTPLHFRVNLKPGPGPFPVALKLYDDASGRPRKLETESEFVIPPPTVDVEARKVQLQGLTTELQAARSGLSRTLATGYYWLHDARGNHIEQAGVVSNRLSTIDPRREADDLREALEVASKETLRVRELATPGMWLEHKPGPPTEAEAKIQADHYPERALAAVLYALVKIDSARRVTDRSLQGLDRGGRPHGSVA